MTIIAGRMLLKMFPSSPWPWEDTTPDNYINGPRTRFFAYQYIAPEMSTARYHRLPSSPTSSSSDIRLTARRSSSLETSASASASSTTLFDGEDSSERGTLRHLPAYDSDPRFRQPKPSPYARAALLIFLVVIIYFAFVMRAEVFWTIIAQQEERVQSESEKWADWAGAQVSVLLYSVNLEK